MILTALLSLTLPVPLPAQEQSTSPRTEDPEWIYYDWVEDGKLTGGRLAVDPANPLHRSDGVARVAGGLPVTTLLDNGPPTNRIDVVFVGDGYTGAQLGQYADDVDNVWPTFLSEEPLSNYATYFNLHRVDVTSNESGVDNDPTQGISRDTALDMAYWCSGIERLLCVNVGAAQAAASNAPDVDSILALSNSTKYGGAGYSDLGTLAGRNGASIEVALHEFGHSFAKLADEYTYGGSSAFTGPEPSSANVSKRDEAQLIADGAKWFLWLDLPNVGAFEGGMYSQTGIYRPTNNSKMRSLGRPFEEFNGERFVRYIYGYVDPIDDATPAGTYGSGKVFSVTPLQPVSHDLDVQWYLDGVALPGETGNTLDASLLDLERRLYTLEVEVVDNTPLVRSPAIRANHMTSRRSWTLRGAKRDRFDGVPPAAGLTVVVTEAAFLVEVAGTENLEPGAPGMLFSVLEGSAGDTHGLLATTRHEPGEPLRFRVARPRSQALSERALTLRAAWFAPPGEGDRVRLSAPLQVRALAPDGGVR